MDSEILYTHSCRICSVELENGVSVFSEEGKKMYLQAKIRKYLYITISVEDKLPKMICENCCMKLEGIHKFATMAVKIQDKFNKLITYSPENSLQPQRIESKGLLHTYLTKGIRDMGIFQDLEVTEMEVRVDPMMILQCSLEDEEDFSTDTMSDTDSLTSKEKLTETENNSDGTSENNRKPYNCTICPRRFTAEFALQNHMWSHLPQKRVLLNSCNNAGHHLTDKINDRSTEQQYLEQFNTSNSSSEADTGENTGLRYNCPVCGKIISTKGNLKVHLETHRPKGKYGCDICGRIFKTQCNLHRHKEYHEGIQFTCVVCGRVYPTNSTLRAHSITHSDLRPHKCPLCDKTFKRNQDLKFHINQHTGARPYQCPYCPKAFASSGNCFSHRKRMHPLEVERDREKAAKIMR